MPENTQRVSVGGFSFENKDEAEQAKKEIEARIYRARTEEMYNHGNRRKNGLPPSEGAV